jgi:DNA repair protein RadC
MNAEAQLNFHPDTMETGNVVALPIDDTGELALLVGLLSYSGGVASATALLKHFPSVGHVLAAEVSQLRAFGLTVRDMGLFRLVRATARHMAQAEVRSRPVLTNWQALIDYLQTAMAHEQTEQFRVLFLDRKNGLIADEVQYGTVSFTPVFPREVVKRALIHNASALIVAHNHPSGDPKPSRSDIETTRELKAAAKALEITLHDHVVIGHGKHASFRSLGLL